MTPACLRDLIDDVLPDDLSTHCPALRPVDESTATTDTTWVSLDPLSTAALRAELGAKP